MIAVVAILTPRMAKKVDEIRAKQSAGQEDPRCKAVRGPYDLPPLPDFKKADFTEMLTDDDLTDDGEDGSDG